MKMKNADGTYSPSFFNMIIDTSEETNIAIKKYSDTFTHEFIHYIQDLILPYSIRSNMTNLSLFQDFCQNAINGIEIKRPFNNWNENSKLIIEQSNYTWGGSIPEDNITQIDSIKQEYFQMTLLHNKSKVYKYTLLMNNKTLLYHVGARDMLEYIANKIEEKHYMVNAPHLPYKTIDYIFDYYGLTQIPYDVRLCIVEFCLYNDNPIHTLFGSFLDNKVIENNLELFTNYEKCYNLLLKNAEWESEGGYVETIESKTKRRLNNFKEELTDHYNAEQFNEIINWIDRVAVFVKNEFTNKFVFSNIYKMSKQELSEFIYYCIEHIGLPLVMNKDYKCITLVTEIIDKQQFVQFFVLQEFLLSYIETTSKSCPIYNFCNANGFICSIECLSVPNLKIHENENCPYSLFLKSYGLANIT